MIGSSTIKIEKVKIPLENLFPIEKRIMNESLSFYFSGKMNQEIELADQNDLCDRYKELKERTELTESEQYELKSVETELVNRFLGGSI